MSASTTALRDAATDKVANKATHPAVEALNRAMQGISQILPKHITAERMAKIALGAMRTNAKLASAARRNPTSFVNAVMQASKLGLEPGIDAHLVPYENRKANSVEIQMIPDYRGLLSLARRTGEITSVAVHIVYEHDEFELSLGLEEKLIHKPKLNGDRGNALLAYAVARFRDGAHHVEWMSVESINAIRDNSKGYQNAKRYSSDTPWISSWEEMARKTLVRRICKYLPRSVELVNANTILDAEERGARAHFDGEFVLVEEDDEAPPALLERAGGEPVPTQRVPTAAETADPQDDALREVEQRSAPAKDDDRAPYEDAIGMVKAGEYDDARAICPPGKREELEAIIASKQNAAAPRPAASRRSAKAIDAE